jgi:hypothetical protein
MRIATRLTVLALAFAIGVPVCAAPGTAQSSENDDIVYRMRTGDTLIALAKRYMITPGAYRIVQRKNGILNALHIPVGRNITIPRSVLKYKPASAKLIAVRGQVILGSGSQAAVGQVLNEGAALATAQSSFVTMQLDNGSRVSLPSNSNFRIVRLRTYMLGGSLDYDFDIAKGGARSTVTPLKSGDDRYRMRTPKAVSAVRGTDFQTRYDPATDNDFAEVVQGGLAVGISHAPALALSAGNGIALPKDGRVIKEALLQPPNLIKPGKLQADPELLFKPVATPDASGFRYTWAADAGFVDQIADISTGTQAVQMPGITDGNYFIRARAISQNGIEGNPVTYAFKRRLNSVKASAGKTGDGFVFKWNGEGAGISRYHFQLFSGPTTGLAMIDETALSTKQISLSDLPPGEYAWRVGSVQYADGEVATNWTDFEKLSVGAP